MNRSVTYDNVVTGNSVVSGTVSSLVGTHIQRSLTQTSGTQWRFDLASSLLFGTVQGNVQFSIASATSGQLPPYCWLMHDGSSDGVVIVQCRSANAGMSVAGTVYVDVQQSAFVDGVL